MMMSEADDSDSAPDDAESPSEDGVERVLDALTPLTEQMDDYRGFAVKFARARSITPTLDRSTVEVRFYYPPRHPKELQMAMGMLQGRGFTPEKKKRGGESSICVYLRVQVGDEPDDAPEPRAEHKQNTF